MQRGYVSGTLPLPAWFHMAVRFSKTKHKIFTLQIGKKYFLHFHLKMQCTLRPFIDKSNDEKNIIKRILIGENLKHFSISQK